MRETDYRRAPLVVAIITALGAALRLISLNTRSLWLDETTAVRQASWDIGRMLDWQAGNVHPPFFHTLLHYWMAEFGRSEVAVRAFVVSWGILAIPLAYWAAKTVYDRRVGVIASALVAFSPFFIWYAQEARMYTMMLVFAFVSTGAFWKALSGRGRGWWAVYGIANAAGIMTQYFYAFIIAGQVLFYVVWFAPEKLRERAPGTRLRSLLRHPRTLFAEVPETMGWLVSLALTVAPLAWWAPRVLGHPELLRGLSEPFNYGWPEPEFGLRFNELILVPIQWATGFHSTDATRNLVAAWPLLVTGVFLTVGFVRRFSARTRMLVASGVLGAAAIGLLGLWQPILESRYFTAVTAPLVILAARLLAELRPRVLRVLGVLLLAGSLVAWADQSYNPDSIVKWDNREAMSVVADDWRPGDVVLLLPSFVSSVPEYYLPADVYASVRPLPLYDGLGRPRNTPAKFSADLAGLVGPAERVWIVATWQDTPRIALDREITAAWLVSRGFVEREDHELRQMRVTKFEARPLPDFFPTTPEFFEPAGGR